MVEYSSPMAPPGFYIVYTNACGRRELASQGRYLDRGLCERAAKKHGVGFSAAEWNGVEWVTQTKGDRSERG